MTRQETELIIQKPISVLAGVENTLQVEHDVLTYDTGHRPVSFDNSIVNRKRPSQGRLFDD
jgi:hypothetical protein